MEDVGWKTEDVIRLNCVRDRSEKPGVPILHRDEDL